jgi:hypothetical protein
MRPHLLGAGLAVVVLAGAAGHATRQDIEDCVLEAARTTPAAPGAAASDRTNVSSDDPALFEAVAACLKSKGYAWVEDVGGVCDDFILPQCFERN